MPKFVVQRSLYEVRERPSKAYSWAAFLIANVIVEFPWQILAGVISWASYYFPIYDSHQSPQRQGLMLLFVTQFYLFTSTFASFIIAALPDAETGGTIATLLFIMATIFNGVMQPPNALPGFWIFMYRVSPLTYLIAGLTATGLHGRPIICSREELSVFNPPSGMTCGDYLGPYLQQAPGRLYNPAATQGCEYCQFRSADQYLSMTNICESSFLSFPIRQWHLGSQHANEKKQSGASAGATTASDGPTLDSTSWAQSSYTISSESSTTTPHPRSVASYAAQSSCVGCSSDVQARRPRGGKQRMDDWSDLQYVRFGGELCLFVILHL